MMKMKNVKVLIMLCLMYGIADASVLMHLDFDETTGTTASDSGSYGTHDGTLTYVTTPFDFDGASVPGKYGNALNFTALGAQYVNIDVADAASLPGDTGSDAGTSFTVSFWAKTSNWVQASLMASFGLNDIRWTIGLNSGGKLVAYARDFNGTSIVQVEIDASASTVGDWHHIAAVFDNGTPTIYLDGVASTTVSTAGWNCDVDMGMEIGRRTYTTKKYFDGAIDDFAILSGVLDGSQILDIYESDVAIPEPATLSLISLGAIALLRRK